MIKILIMDDDASSRNILETTLSPLGHALLIAENGKTAIEITQRERPDLALLDMRVPDMNSLEVLDTLRRFNTDIRCIMLSGLGDVESAVGALKRGACDYVGKPLNAGELLSVVTGVLSSLVEAPQAETVEPETAAPAPVPAPAPPPASAPATAVKTAPERAAAAAPDGERVPAVKKASVKRMPFIRPLLGNALQSGMKSLSKLKRYYVPIIAGCVSVLLVGAVAVLHPMFNQSAEFPLAYHNPTGMCLDGSTLWVSDWVSGNIYQHARKDKLPVIHVHKTLNSQPSGLAFDGEFLWSCSAQEKQVYKHKKDGNLTVLSIFEFPAVIPSSIYSDGVNLWIIDSVNSKIHRHKLDEALTLVDVYDSPVSNPSALFRDGQYLYLSSYESGRICRVTAKDFSVDVAYEMPVPEAKRKKINGMVYDGEFIWFCTDGAASAGRFKKNALKRLRV